MRLNCRGKAVLAPLGQELLLPEGHTLKHILRHLQGLLSLGWSPGATARSKGE